jgi:hypothetical protein
MAELDYEIYPRGVTKGIDDAGLIAEGSIVFTADDNLTVEKITPAIPLYRKLMHSDNLFLLAIEKPAENTAGDLTVNTYNQIKINGTDVRDVLHTTHTVEKITGAATYRDFLIQGLFFGQNTIKIGMKFAADSGAITCHYKLYRL